MKKTMFPIAVLMAGFAVVALAPCVAATAESRILHLPGGYVQPYGSYTTGGEFPGAKAELGFEQEGDRRFARLSFDLTKGAYVGYKVTEKIPADTSRVEGECEWEVPASRGPWTECRDLFGNVIEPPVVSGRKLRLTECPIYLRF